MATRILGPTDSRRRRRFLLVPMLAAAAVSALLLVGSAGAVHDLEFQLDGNALASVCGTTPDGGPSGPNACTVQTLDWDSLFNANTSPKGPPLIDPANSPGFTQAGFNRDFGVKVSNADNCNFTNTTSTTFCTADPTTFATGSKDIQNISGGGADQSGNWQCNRDNNVNSKIDIMNAYSAAYTASDGDKLLYFALEKNKDNGNNNAGFWFLQGDASCVSSGSATNFSGNHQNGDILVTSAFTAGGGVSSILVYRWAGGANGCIDSNGNPNKATGGCNQLPFGSGADCKTTPVPPSDNICATTNSGTKVTNTNITVPWLTADATLGVGHTVVPPDFFEGAINLTEAFKSVGGTAPQCFNTFLADTRSSQTPTATLFDFARGRLGQCTTTLTTKAGDTANGGSASPTSIGTGSVSSGTDTATLTITGASTWGGTLSWYLCGPIASGLCDNTKGVPVTSRTVSNSSPASDFVSDTATLTSAGRYCWTAHFEPNQASKDAGISADDDDGVNECFTVAPVTPTLTTQASCTSTPCVLGVDTISDSATLTGTASSPGSGGGGTPGVYTTINPTTPGSPADNSISWTLYGPSNSSCTTNVKLSTSRTVSGDGTYPTNAQLPVSYKPTLSDGVGNYVFVASYPGESPNTNAATSTTCSDSNETVTLIGSASSASAQRWLPNDRVVLSTTAGGLDGTLTVTLYQGTFSGTAANCTAGTATAVTGQSYTFDTSPGGVPDPSGTAYNTNNSTFFVGTKSDGTPGGAAGNYFWLVHYLDNNLTDPPDRCETSNLTITDG
jgi:hypothetical protein